MLEIKLPNSCRTLWFDFYNVLETRLDSNSLSFWYIYKRGRRTDPLIDLRVKRSSMLAVALPVDSKTRRSRTQLDAVSANVRPIWKYLWTLWDIQEHKIGPKDLWHIRSNTITKPMIIFASYPGLITRLKTSVSSTTPPFFTLFLDIIATSSPLELRMQQLRLLNEPSITKSDPPHWLLHVVSLFRNTSASALELENRCRELLLIENSLSFVGISPDLLQS